MRLTHFQPYEPSSCSFLKFLTDTIFLRLTFTAPYSSSKAALNNLSECLRLELSPFGVSVVTILGGLIETHFHSGDMQFKLRPDSLYAPIEEIIESWANGKSKPKGQSAEDFAASIAGDILGQGNGGMVWKGPNAGSAKWATKFFPASLMVSTSTLFPCPFGNEAIPDPPSPSTHYCTHTERDPSRTRL